MGVKDYPVHELTRIYADTPYGCSNAVRSDGYWAPNRMYRIGGTYTNERAFIFDESSRLCRNTKREIDPRCGSCKRESDEEYLRDQ